MVFSTLQMKTSDCLGTQTMIGEGLQMTREAQPAGVFHYVQLLLLEAQGNKQLLHLPALKLSILPSLLLPMKLYGYEDS